jgi:hypothetical protein
MNGRVAHALRPLLFVNHAVEPDALRAAAEDVAHASAAYDLVHVCPRAPSVACWAMFGCSPPFLPGELEAAGTDLLRRCAREFPAGVPVRMTLLPSNDRVVAHVSKLVHTHGHDVIVAPGAPPARWQILSDATRRWLVKQSLAPVVWVGR